MQAGTATAMKRPRNIVRLAGDHSIDVGLLPEKPVVLDVGCRGFDFARNILELRPEALVICMDPDPAIQDPNIPGIEYIQKALTADDVPLRKYAAFSSGEANFITDADSYYDAKIQYVKCITIEALMRGLGIEYLDLVKLDCENSEFGILESWPGRIAGQLSIEFHDFQNRNRWDNAYFDQLFSGPLRDYEVVQHELTPVGPDQTLSHWDSLLVLKS